MRSHDRRQINWPSRPEDDRTLDPIDARIFLVKPERRRRNGAVTSVSQIGRLMLTMIVAGFVAVLMFAPLKANANEQHGSSAFVENL